MKNHEHYSVIIVGASIAGCSAALQYAEKGVKVLLVEKANSMSSYKKICTHFVQPCCSHIMKELDIYDDVVEIGKRSKAEFWTSAGGWLTSNKINYSNGEFAINLERSKFDQYYKEKVGQHPNIHLLLNSSIESIHQDENTSITIIDVLTDEDQYTYSGDLLVAADGRYSKVAEILENETVVYPNDRFVHFAYYQDLYKSATDDNFSKFWMLGEDMAFIYPLKDNCSLVALYINKAKKAEWKHNANEKFIEMLKSLPDLPELNDLNRITGLRGMDDIQTYKRESTFKGIPFIGDAALSLDPAAGTGCSFAMLSSSWLVNYTLDAIKNGNRSALVDGLQNYHNFHSTWMKPHISGITADSLVTKDINGDNMLYSQLKQDEELLEQFLDLTGRLITPKQFQMNFFKKAMAKKSETINNH